jgi:hypothetical protein
MQNPGAEIAPREREGLFEIVRWNTANGSATSRNSARVRVLILRSARAGAVPQNRPGVRASRRMRTRDWVRPHASRRIAARLGCGSACARRAAMLLSMRPRVRGAFWPTDASWRRTNLRLQESIAGRAPLFPDCYLQWMAQLQRVEPSARGPVVPRNDLMAARCRIRMAATAD